MKKTILCLTAMLMLLCAGVMASAQSAVPTEAEAYQKISAMKASYPEGRRWTNSSYATWKGGPYGAGGCMGFAFVMSDAAFGDLPARDIYPKSGNPIKISDLRVGDILRLPGHSVVVLQKHSNHIIITEGNYQSKVHWGRKITAAQVNRAKYYTTRYPSGNATAAKSAAAPANTSTAPLPKTDVAIGGKTYKLCDISSHWAREHIISCLTSSLMSTTGDCENAYFRPDDNATRAEVVCALYKAKGSPKPKSASSFTDVSGEWYADAVSWASENSIVSGVTATSFAPNAPITREQLAVIMYRFAAAEGTLGDISSFSDCKNVSSFAETPLMWTVEQNIISGKDGKLIPQGCTTRAEFATMLVRFSMALVKA